MKRWLPRAGGCLGMGRLPSILDNLTGHQAKLVAHGLTDLSLAKWKYIYGSLDSVGFSQEKAFWRNQ
jgi:hypothetical protein